MYQTHFRFNQKPFEAAPDTNFLFLNNTYREILSALVYGVSERKGVVALIGDVGTGKTLMLKALMERLDGGTRAAFLVHTNLPFIQMLMIALNEFGLVDLSEHLTTVQAVKKLSDFALKTMESDGTVVLIVDEAQSLRPEAINNLRMLSNLEHRGVKLIQIVLSGQPELDEKLQGPEWRSLLQRVSIKRYSFVLSRDDTCAFIEHRLKVAGYDGPPLFTDRALELIWQHSEGAPREINVICDNALLIAYSMGKKQVDEDILLEAIADVKSPLDCRTVRVPLARSGDLQTPSIRRPLSDGASGNALQSLLSRFCPVCPAGGFVTRGLNNEKIRIVVVTMAIAAVGMILFTMPR